MDCDVDLYRTLVCCCVVLCVCVYSWYKLILAPNHHTTGLVFAQGPGRPPVSSCHNSVLEAITLTKSVLLET